MKITFTAEYTDEDKKQEVTLNNDGYENLDFVCFSIDGGREIEFYIDDLQAALTPFIEARKLSAERDKRLE